MVNKTACLNNSVLRSFMVNQDMYIGSFFNIRKVQSSYIHSNHIAYGTEVETHDIHGVKRKKKNMQNTRFTVLRRTNKLIYFQNKALN